MKRWRIERGLGFTLPRLRQPGLLDALARKAFPQICAQRKGGVPKPRKPAEKESGGGLVSRETAGQSFARSRCCASMIMSPFVLDRNVPLIGPPKGGQIGADTDEPEGVRKGRSAGAGAEPAAESGGCGSVDAPQLSAGEAAVEAVSRGRGCGSEAPQRRTTLASCPRAEVSGEGAAAGAGEVRRAGRGALWAHAGGGALGLGGWAEGGCGNAATLDAGGGVVESGAEAAAAPSSPRAQGALRGDGADGRELSRLAGGARPAGLLDRPGR